MAQAAITELRRGPSPDPSASFGQRLEAAWGPTCFAIFFRPYNEKLWGRSLDELPADCVGDYLPSVDVGLVERGASGSVFYPGYNAELTYPASGRLGDAMEAVARPLSDRIHYGERVAAVDLRRREIHTAAETTYRYDRLISTIPLRQLLDLSGFEAPKADLFAASEILNVRIGIRGTIKTQCQWVYVPDAGLPFHRIGFPRNVNPRTCPPGCASLSVEYTIPANGARCSSSEVAPLALEYADRLELVDVESASPSPTTSSLRHTRCGARRAGGTSRTSPRHSLARTFISQVDSGPGITSPSRRPSSPGSRPRRPPPDSSARY